MSNFRKTNQSNKKFRPGRNLSFGTDQILFWVIWCAALAACAFFSEKTSESAQAQTAASSPTAAQPAAAQPGPQHWVDDFESPAPKWDDWGGDSPHQIILRQREKGEAFTGSGFEHLQIQCQAAGSTAYLTYPIYPALINASLKVQLAVRANRSGTQLLARVVLPFTRDPATGKAVSFFVFGGRYSSLGRWQLLQIDDIQRQVQQMTARRQQEWAGLTVVDSRNAYLDRLILNVYSGAGTLDLFADSMEIQGAIPLSPSKLEKGAFSPDTSAQGTIGVPQLTGTAQDGVTKLSGPTPQMRDFPPVQPQSNQGAGNQQTAGMNQGLGNQQAAGMNQGLGNQQAAGMNQGLGNQQAAGMNQGMGNQQAAGMNQGMGNQQAAGMNQGMGNQQAAGMNQGMGNQQAAGMNQGMRNAEGSDSLPTDPVFGLPANQSAQPFEPKKFQIYLNRGVLTIKDTSRNTPIFVRAIRHRGESLSFLADRGFNTVWLQAPPTRQMEAEAALCNIWFICPPPVNLENLNADPRQILKSEGQSGLLLNRVLAWDMGKTPDFASVERVKAANSAGNGSTSLPQDAVELAERQVSLLRQIPSDQLPERPILAFPDKDLTEFSTTYDILTLTRSPLNSSMSMVSYGLWLRSMRNLVRFQQSIFVRIPTQFNPLLQNQWRQIAEKINNSSSDYHISGTDRQYVPDSIPLEHLRLMAYNAIMAGSRGIFFESTSRLDSQDEETIFRAKSLELVNLEILALEQWISQGERFTTIPSANHSDIAGALLATMHLRLLIPLVIEKDSQYVCGAGADRKIQFLIRGLPETYQCWHYSLNGLSPLVNHRMAGGVEIELDELPLTATIVMTQNSIISNSISKRIAKFAPKLARRMKELAEMRLKSYLQFNGTKALEGNEAMWYERAKLYLDGSEKALRAHEYSDAFILAQRAMRPIALMEKRQWQESTAKFPSPNFQPTGVSFRTLLLQEKWLRAVEKMRLGQNLLPHGDLENIQAALQSGWRHFQKPNGFPGVTSRAEINEEAAHTGRLGLKLHVSASQKEQAPLMFDSPPIMIQSPSVHVGPNGTVYQVEMWVNIPNEIFNSVDGLKITDSNSGDVLAERVKKTNGWQKISFQRIANSQNPVYISISMNGYGTAYVDDIKIHPMGEF